MPSLSSFTVLLCDLLKKVTKFPWNETYQETFGTVKYLVCKDTTLQYFNIHKPITIQANASWKDLSATLFQDGHSVTFTSKALTPVEQHYCYVRQCHFICALLLELSKGLASCMILFIVCTVIRNCLSLGSLVFATLKWNVREIT